MGTSEKGFCTKGMPKVQKPILGCAKKKVKELTSVPICKSGQPPVPSLLLYPVPPITPLLTPSLTPHLTPGYPPPSPPPDPYYPPSYTPPLPPPIAFHYLV